MEILGTSFPITKSATLSEYKKINQTKR